MLTCLAGVTLGGILAATAPSLALLIAGRALQGLGLALVPLAMAAARDRLGELRSRRAIAMLSVVTAVGVGLGYPVTGFIAEHADLAAAVWFGAVVTALALLLTAAVVPDATDVPAHRPLDVAGAAWISVGLVALLLGLEKGPDWGWAATGTLTLIAVAIVCLALWSVHELRVADPLVDLRLVRRRAVLTADLAGLTLGIAMYMVISLMTQFVQLTGFGLGASVFVGGLTLVPLSVASFVASRFLLPFQRRLGVRPMIPAGALTVGLGAALFAASASALWQAFVAMGVVGLGLGFTFAAMPGLIVGATPRSETGSAMGFYQVSRYVGFSIGSGLTVTLLRAFGTGGEPTLGSYRTAFWCAAAVCALAAAVAWIVPGRALAAPGDEELERLQMEEGLVGAAGLERDL
jgi:MFS family permease